MKKHIQILDLATLLAGARELTAETVTLVVNAQNPTQHLSIASNQVAELVSFQAHTSMNLRVQKDGGVFYYDPLFRQPGFFLGSELPHMLWPLQIAGPATFSFAGQTNSDGRFLDGYCTFKITPESTPPDKTIILLAGSKGANIYLEMSTNLFDWSTISPGTYSSETNNLFFRIRAEKLP